MVSWPFLTRLKRVVPLSTDRSVLDVEVLHLVLGHGLPCFKRAFQQGGPHCQPRVGRRAAKKIEHGFQRAQRLACPIQTDVTEQAMFDGVPLGAPSGIVAHVDRQPIAIAHLLLELQLPRDVQRDLSQQ